jgi:hypothetical protein
MTQLQSLDNPFTNQINMKTLLSAKIVKKQMVTAHCSRENVMLVALMSPGSIGCDHFESEEIVQVGLSYLKLV